MVEFSEPYTNWLIGHIEGFKKGELNYTYEHSQMLIKLLYTPFDIIKMKRDEDRIKDGLYLRECYISEFKTEKEEAFENDCSVLEVLVALAIRMENDILSSAKYGPRAHVWFWMMIQTMHLDDVKNEDFDEEKVVKIVVKMMERKYEKDGNGGLFFIPECQKDMRKIDIWHQMNDWVSENFGKLF